MPTTVTLNQFRRSSREKADTGVDGIGIYPALRAVADGLP
jgi:hypothetical protein